MMMFIKRGYLTSASQLEYSTAIQVGVRGCTGRTESLGGQQQLGGPSSTQTGSVRVKKNLIIYAKFHITYDEPSFQTHYLEEGYFLAFRTGIVATTTVSRSVDHCLLPPQPQRLASVVTRFWTYAVPPSDLGQYL